jgi:dienelactone hydrolase
MSMILRPALLLFVLVLPACGKPETKTTADQGSSPAPAAAPAGQQPTAPLALDYGLAPLPAMVELPPFTEIEQGIEKAVVDLGVSTGKAGESDRLHIIRPTNRQGNQSMPCVFLAAAGATVFTGMGIADGDDAELIPYAKAGFVAIGYETDGEWADELVTGLTNGFAKYRKSQAGLINARNAIDYSLKSLPEIDPKRIYAVGHSSAGRQAFLLAAIDPRIKACVSFNGVLDVIADVQQGPQEAFRFLPGDALQFLSASSPRSWESKISCPVLLFHTTDDQVVSVERAKTAAARLQGLGKQVKLVTMPGNHYEPMINRGIPVAIEWLQGLP